MTGFDLPAGDNAVLRRAQLAVTGLVAGEIELGARGAGLAFGRTQRSGLLIETGTTDELVFRKAGKPCVVGARPRELRVGGNALRLQRFDLQLQIAGIQFAKQISAADAVADIHETSRQLAADPERQRGFFASADFAGVSGQTIRSGACAGVRPHHQDRTRRLCRLPTVAAGRQSGHHQHQACRSDTRCCRAHCHGRLIRSGRGSGRDTIDPDH